MRAFTIATLSSGQTIQWDAFVDSHPEGTLYHRIAWRRMIETVFGHETHYLVAQDSDSSITGVLPLVRLKSRLFGDFLVSLPYVNYGGALGSSDGVVEELMSHAAETAATLGCSHIEFRDVRRRADPWSTRTDKIVMELPLPSTTETLWTGFDSKLRAQVKRARKESIDSECGGAELLPEFYHVFAQNMRDLGTPVYSFDFFATILQTFGNSAFVIVTRHKGKAVAAGLLCGYKDRLEIPWASSIQEYNRFGVNMLLYWTAFEKAIEKGYRVFDFGRSSVGSGTYRFKKQWGARERQLYWHYWLRSGGHLPNLTPNNRKYRLAIELWKRLPLFVANRLGPVLVKNLP